jgi:glutamyl-tRNA(Gln) amidotransferase subunit E
LSGFDDIRRLGPEFAGYVRSSTGLKGLFHSDELPGYGITGSEVSMVRSSLSLKSPLDGFVLICSTPEKAKKALSAVIDRAKSAFQGVIPEVRKALPDGRTEFMRPISGAARMYPETDIPPFHVQDRFLEGLREKIPEDPAIRIERVSIDNRISRESAIQLNNADQIDRYEHLVRSGSDRRVLAHILLKGHEILGEDLDIVPDRIISWLSLRSANGSIPKESIPDMLETTLEQVRSGMDIKTIEKGMEERFASSASISKELEDAIEGIMVQKKDFILDRKGSSVGPLMGILMNEFRGRLDGAIIEKELRTRIEKLLEGK